MVDFRKWAKQSPEHIFNAWCQRLKKRTLDVPVKKPKSKVLYLNKCFKQIKEVEHF